MTIFRAASAPVLTLALLVNAVLLSSVSFSATRSWDGGGGADTAWTTGANWDVFNTVPVASDTAQFDRGAAFTYDVTFPLLFPAGDIATDRLIVGSNTITFENDHSNTNYLVTAAATGEVSRGVMIGEEANDTAADLTSHLALLSTGAATLGQVAGSSGTLTLNQNNDQFNVTSSGDLALIVGRYGTGVVNVSGGADVNVTGSTVLGLHFGSSGTAFIDGSGSTWTVGASLVVGGQATLGGGTGTLSITNQGLVDVGGTLKLWPGGTVALNGGTLGTANMELAGGAFNWTSGTLAFKSLLSVDPSGPLGDSMIVDAPRVLAASALSIGDAGDGTLNITDGGRVTGSSFGKHKIGTGVGTTGVVTVTGAGSTLTGGDLTVGLGGNGTLDISAGGQVSNQGDQDYAISVFIGDEPGSTGHVTVDGAGSEWLMRSISNTLPTGNSITLAIGLEGQGTLDVTNGGQVSISNSYGSNSVSPQVRASVVNGVVTVDGAGSKLLVANAANSGLAALARFTIGEDGTLNVSNGGTVTVRHLGSQSVPHSLIGFGALNITTGGQVTSDYGTFFAGSATVDGIGSTWTITYELNMNGDLAVVNGAIVQAANVIVNAEGAVRGDGSIVGNVQNDGRVSPGVSPGALSIDGDYTQTSSGDLLIELASSGFDQLQVTGTATLAGTLTVDFLGGYIPDIGQTFTILTADDIDGQFIADPSSSVPGLIFDVIYNAQSVVLAILPEFSADFDLDRDVDDDDLAQWEGDYGLNGNSDADGDGDSDGADFLAWQQQYGSGVGLLAAGVAVPEPGTLVLALTFAAMCWRRGPAT